MSIPTYKPIATMITCFEEDEEAMVMLGAYRELERENAALRSDLSKCNNLSEIRRDAFYDEKSARWAMVDRMRELERENAALRERLEQLQDFAVLVLRGLDSGYIRSKPFIDTSDDNATEYPVRTLEEIARAALARKEVQP